MKPSKISDLLGKISKEIGNPNFPDVPKIEYDLLLQHVRELYDELSNAQSVKSNAGQSATGNQSDNDTHAFKQHKSHLQPENLLDRRTIYANENLLLNEVAERKEVTPAKEEVKKAAHYEGVKQEVKTTHANKPSSINETIRTSETLNEKHKVTSKEVHKKLSVKPLKDLIDLNKKFILLSELFKGDAGAFATAVNYIDTLEDYKSAESFIHSQLVSGYSWDESSQPVMLFNSLVKQRFGME